MEEKNNIVIYQLEDGKTKIDVKLKDETVWLSQQQMAELFSTSRTNIVEHINNIYSGKELDKNATCQNFRQVRIEGNRTVNREIPYYNLDMIISLGYRIKSKVATNFRRWATERLKEYMIKGFAMDDERLKGNRKMKGQLSFFEKKSKCVLMSLREEYYDAMLEGRKHYEYRTRYLKEASDAYIYISKTKKSVVAKIRFGEPIIGDAQTIAAIAEQEEPGSYNGMMEYLYNNIGYAIPIEEVPLSELQKNFSNFVVPQSYYILDKKPELLSFLKSRERKN